MYKTLLFDLDGTLLSMDMHEFVERYLESISCRFAHLFKHGDFVAKLMQSTQTMLMNKDPFKTNEEVFMEDFLPRSGLSRKEVTVMFTDYYIRDFPKLQCYTRAEPLIKGILEVAVKQKRELVIATNPVFPEIAIRQRLQWAGIGHLPFRLITTYENMHFCKPHLEYYAEILKKLNRLPGDCLMIGNDAREDLAANGVGISTFLLKNHLINDATETYAADHEGYLEDLYRLVCSF
jgi:FMN phosphatase YigB (HAD superfamily)